MDEHFEPCGPACGLTSLIGSCSGDVLFWFLSHEEVLKNQYGWACYFTWWWVTFNPLLMSKTLPAHLEPPRLKTRPRAVSPSAGAHQTEMVAAPSRVTSSRSTRRALMIGRGWTLLTSSTHPLKSPSPTWRRARSASLGSMLWTPLETQSPPRWPTSWFRTSWVRATHTGHPSAVRLILFRSSVVDSLPLVKVLCSRKKFEFTVKIFNVVFDPSMKIWQIRQVSW